MSAIIPIPDDPLTAQENAFAQLVAIDGNLSVAYRAAFNVAHKTRPGYVDEAACRLAKVPQVRARINELRSRIADETLISARDVIKDWIDVALADPNELTRRVRWNCRHCHGDEHAYQWRDTAEYLEACAAATEADPPRPPPSLDGGFGFVGDMSPAPDCPRCYGLGEERVILADTSKLTGPARKLFKGIGKNGEVLMHDQETARQMLARAMGLLKDTAPPLDSPGRQRGTVIDAAATPVDAAQAYLELVR